MHRRTRGNARSPKRKHPQRCGCFRLGRRNRKRWHGGDDRQPGARSRGQRISGSRLRFARSDKPQPAKPVFDNLLNRRTAEPPNRRTAEPLNR
ncbi:hypothetical protein GSH03_10335 [Burkholderia pseudomallei]|nr:hypothetical protein [Burkholderia pseudomallei]